MQPTGHFSHQSQHSQTTHVNYSAANHGYPPLNPDTATKTNYSNPLGLHELQHPIQQITREENPLFPLLTSFNRSQIAPGMPRFVATKEPVHGHTKVEEIQTTRLPIIQQSVEKNSKSEDQTLIFEIANRR